MSATRRATRFIKSTPEVRDRPTVRMATAPARRLTAADVMTGREVAVLLHAPVSTVEDWARRDIIPSIKIGRRRLYVRHNIEAVLIDPETTSPSRK